MSAVDPVFAQWLQNEGLWQVQMDLLGKARWGDQAITTERMTALALKADASAEAARHLGFLAGPLAVDEHLLQGEWRAHIGRVITVTIDQLGYDQGVDVFVIGAADDLATALSTVTVLRRL